MANASDRWPKYRTPLNEWLPAWQVRPARRKAPYVQLAPQGTTPESSSWVSGSDREAVL
jgi:hypothetical protein